MTQILFLKIMFDLKYKKLVERNVGYPQFAYCKTNEDLIFFDSLERKNITEEEFRKLKDSKKS